MGFCYNSLYLTCQIVIIRYIIAMKTISYTAQADRALAKMPRRHAEAVEAKIEQYAREPESLSAKIQSLQGTDVLRLRVGNYRVIFNEELVVLNVLDIGNRKAIYKSW
jgi:mRNA interferase RelE/StbE